MAEHREPSRILIAGLGNLLLQDDGVGVHAVRDLAKNPPQGALVAEIGTAVISGLHLLEWADRILAIDAMNAGGSPGSVYLMSGYDLEDPARKLSLHELGMLGAFRLLPPDHPKPEILVIGVETDIIDYGMELSPIIQEALPAVLRLAGRIVDGWKEDPDCWTTDRLAELAAGTLPALRGRP